MVCTNLRKVRFSLLKRSSFTIGGSQTLVGFPAATGIMESDPTWVEVRSLPLVSGHFDQLFIAISLKTPFLASLHQHQLTGRRWLGQWRHYYPLLHCIFPPADLFYHSLPFCFYSGYCWPVSGCRYLGFTSPHDRHELFTASTYVHRYPAHAAISILIHSQKQFFASQLSDNTDKAWGGCLPPLVWVFTTYKRSSGV